ncbi:MAG: PepSY domain-containing protein [Betaproteobacteria bacterium]
MFVPVPAIADSDHLIARKLRESGEILPLEKILQRARAAKPGQVIEAELESKKGRYVYEVEILDAAGQVWEVKLDAKTGELIKIERDD